VNSKLIIVNPILNLPHDISVVAVKEVEDELYKYMFDQEEILNFRGGIKGNLPAERIMELADFVTQKVLKAVVDVVMYKYCPGYKLAVREEGKWKF